MLVSTPDNYQPFVRCCPSPNKLAGLITSKNVTARRELLARIAVLLLVSALATSCAGSSTASDSPDTLSSASARDYGFDFDARVWELERRPQLSVVRCCVHPAGVNFPKVFFSIGCQGELIQQRGFAYAWTLQSRLTECPLDPADKDREFVLGFTHGPSIDELPPEVSRELGPGAIEWSTDAAQSLALARRHLGRWP